MKSISLEAERDKRFRLAAEARYQAIRNGVDEASQSRLDAEFERYFPGNNAHPPAITKAQGERLREIGQELREILAKAMARLNRH